MISYEEKSEKGIPWHTSFIGQLMQHNYWLYKIVDDVIKEREIHSIVEIGTGRGALTSVFGLWGLKKNIPVLSIDRDSSFYDKKLLSKLNVRLFVGDEFSEETKQEILKTVNDKPTWIYCDGGNKMKEFLTFAPLIPSGSIISAHDLGVEFNSDLALSSIGPGIVEPYKKELWMDLNVQLALFERI